MVFPWVFPWFSRGFPHLPEKHGLGGGLPGVDCGQHMAGLQGAEDGLGAAAFEAILG